MVRLIWLYEFSDCINRGLYFNVLSSHSGRHFITDASVCCPYWVLCCICLLKLQITHIKTEKSSSILSCNDHCNCPSACEETESIVKIYCINQNKTKTCIYSMWCSVFNILYSVSSRWDLYPCLVPTSTPYVSLCNAYCITVCNQYCK